MGNMGHQLVGQITFEDKENNVRCELKPGTYYMKKQDFLWGEIFHNDKKVSTVEGTYVGFLDIDGKRYWDYRAKDQICFKNFNRRPDDVLPSHS